MATAPRHLVVYCPKGMFIDKIRHFLLCYLILSIVLNSPKQKSSTVQPNGTGYTFYGLRGHDAARVAVATVEEELSDYIVV